MALEEQQEGLAAPLASGMYDGTPGAAAEGSRPTDIAALNDVVTAAPVATSLTPELHPAAAVLPMHNAEPSAAAMVVAVVSVAVPAAHTSLTTAWETAAVPPAAKQRRRTDAAASHGAVGDSQQGEDLTAARSSAEASSANDHATAETAETTATASSTQDRAITVQVPVPAAANPATAPSPMLVAPAEAVDNAAAPASLPDVASEEAVATHAAIADGVLFEPSAATTANEQRTADAAPSEAGSMSQDGDDVSVIEEQLAPLGAAQDEDRWDGEDDKTHMDLVLQDLGDTDHITAPPGQDTIAPGAHAPTLPKQLEPGPADQPTVESLKAELEQLRAAMQLGSLSAPPAAHAQRHQQQITLPSSMTLWEAWQLYCCGDIDQQQEPLMHVAYDRSVQLVPKPLAGHFWKVMHFVRQAVVDLLAWHDNPTREESLVMMRHPLLPGAVLCSGTKPRQPLEHMGLLTVRNHIIIRDKPPPAPTQTPGTALQLPAPRAALRPATPAALRSPAAAASRLPAPLAALRRPAPGDAPPQETSNRPGTNAAVAVAAAAAAPGTATANLHEKRKRPKKVADAAQPTAKQQKISAARSTAAEGMTSPAPRAQRLRQRAAEDKRVEVAATENDTALTAAHVHSNQQADAAVTTMRTPSAAHSVAQPQETPNPYAAEQHLAAATDSAATDGAGGTHSGTKDKEHESSNAAAAVAAPKPGDQFETRKRPTEVAEASETAAKQRKKSAPAGRAKLSDSAVATDRDAAQTQPDAAPINTTLPTNDGRQKRGHPDAAPGPQRKRVAATASAAPPPAQPRTPAARTADSDAATQDDSARTDTGHAAAPRHARQLPASSLGAAEASGGASAATASLLPVHKRSAQDKHEGAPAAKRVCGAAAQQKDSRTTNHCVLMSSAHVYCTPTVDVINAYVHARFHRRLHVVSTDGDCAFYTISFFSGIPHGVLRWTAAVATAIRIATVAHLPPRADASQQVRALLAYYGDELAKKAKKATQHCKRATKSKQAHAGAVAAGVAAVREEDIASAAVKALLQPKEWVESSVLALVCDVLQLRMAVLTVADEKDSAKWYVLPLYDTSADFQEQVVDESVRLCVFFRDHYSPCMLETPVDAALVPTCRGFPGVVVALCAEVDQLPAVAWPQLIPGATDVKVRVLCVAHLLACVWR